MKTDYDLVVDMLSNGHFRFASVIGTKDEPLDDNKYIANYTSYTEDNIIIVHEFNHDGKLRDIYVADACHSLEEFMEL